MENILSVWKRSWIFSLVAANLHFPHLPPKISSSPLSPSLLLFRLQLLFIHLQLIFACTVFFFCLDWLWFSLNNSMFFLSSLIQIAMSVQTNNCVVWRAIIHTGVSTRSEASSAGVRSASCHYKRTRACSVLVSCSPCVCLSASLFFPLIFLAFLHTALCIGLDFCNALLSSSPFSSSCSCFYFGVFLCAHV